MNVLFAILSLLSLALADQQVDVVNVVSNRFLHNTLISFKNMTIETAIEKCPKDKNNLAEKDCFLAVKRYFDEVFEAYKPLAIRLIEAAYNNTDGRYFIKDEETNKWVLKRDTSITVEQGEVVNSKILLSGLDNGLQYTIAELEKKASSSSSLQKRIIVSGLRKVPKIPSKPKFPSNVGPKPYVPVQDIRPLPNVNSHTRELIDNLDTLPRPRGRNVEPPRPDGQPRPGSSNYDDFQDGQSVPGGPNGIPEVDMYGNYRPNTRQENSPANSQHITNNHYYYGNSKPNSRPSSADSVHSAGTFVDHLKPQKSWIKRNSGRLFVGSLAIVAIVFLFMSKKKSSAVESDLSAQSEYVEDPYAQYATDPYAEYYTSSDAGAYDQYYDDYYYEPSESDSNYNYESATYDSNYDYESATYSDDDYTSDYDQFYSEDQFVDEQTSLEQSDNTAENQQSTSSSQSESDSQSEMFPDIMDSEGHIWTFDYEVRLYYRIGDDGEIIYYQE